MSTRSLIGMEKDGEITYIYCHYDGYPSYNGKLLLEYWNTPERVQDLINLGNLSILGDKIGKKVDFNKFSTSTDSEFEGDKKQCLAYGRDRGEEDQKAKTLPTIGFMEKDHMRSTWAEWVYIYKLTDKGWQWFYGPTDLKPDRMNIRPLTKKEAETY